MCSDVCGVGYVLGCVGGFCFGLDAGLSVGCGFIAACQYVV